MRKIIFFSILSLVLVGCSHNVTTQQVQEPITPKPNKNINQAQTMPTIPTTSVTKATIKTNLGDITVEFYGEDSPKTVGNFVKLAQEGFYNGTKFHRVINGFMIQGGDPLSKENNLKNMWGTGDPGYKFEDEINSHKLVKGSIAMANSGPNTNGSQFFIVTAESTPWLDGKHTNFGKVIDGIEIVEKIENVVTEGPDRPVENVTIESIELE
ncbi:peptidylprolyl isomerase [Patescibacteria group bacterium]|nr:peptidylprolyl isomerase [Patescibacteria group bacterium]